MTNQGRKEQKCLLACLNVMVYFISWESKIKISIK